MQRKPARDIVWFGPPMQSLGWFVMVTPAQTFPQLPLLCHEAGKAQHASDKPAYAGVTVTPKGDHSLSDCRVQVLKKHVPLRSCLFGDCLSGFPGCGWGRGPRSGVGPAWAGGGLLRGRVRVCLSSLGPGGKAERREGQEEGRPRG